MDIIVYLSNPSLRENSSNHTVPLLDIIIGSEEYDFIVMPVLRPFNDPPFVSVDEVLEFVQQSLEVRPQPFFTAQLFELLLGTGFLARCRRCA